jgi:hypothetical protein
MKIIFWVTCLGLHGQQVHDDDQPQVGLHPVKISCSSSSSSNSTYLQPPTCAHSWP